jgi:hypothetical protein
LAVNKLIEAIEDYITKARIDELNNSKKLDNWFIEQRIAELEKGLSK